MSDRDQWTQAWTALGLETPAQCFDELQIRYAEPHRAYHTWQHVEECFAMLASSSSLAARLPEIELALWFHDAVYDTHAEDNEEQSAQWAERALLDQDASASVAGRVRDLVLATKHGQPPKENDAKLLVDVDLSILGSEPARFWKYEEQIRTEYGWVPWEDYRPARARLLGEFLARPRLYGTDWFLERLEERARVNLQASRERLRD